MDDVVHLGDDTNCPSTQVPTDADCDLPAGLIDEHVQTPFTPAESRGVVGRRGRSCTGRSPSRTSHSQALVPHKVRGPNWTEA